MPRRRRTFSTPADARAALQAIVIRALAMLDALDGDADFEPDSDGEEDNQDCCAAADDDLSSQPDRQHRNDFGPGTLEDVEAEPAEASAQPTTLSPDRRPTVVHHPSRRAMRAAYRHNGDPIPANLRLFGRARA